MTTTPPAIAATGLRKSYGDHVVLDGIDLHVPEAAIFQSVAAGRGDLLTATGHPGHQDQLDGHPPSPGSRLTCFLVPTRCGDQR